MFLKSNAGSRPIIWLKILYKQVQCTRMALGLGKSGNFSIPNVKSFGENSFVYNQCILLNYLPSHIKENQSNYDFEMTVKKHFLELLPE